MVRELRSRIKRVTILASNFGSTREFYAAAAPTGMPWQGPTQYKVLLLDGFKYQPAADRVPRVVEKVTTVVERTFAPPRCAWSRWLRPANEVRGAGG